MNEKLNRIQNEYFKLVHETRKLIESNSKPADFTTSFEEEDDTWYELPQQNRINKYGYSNTYYIYSIEKKDNIFCYIGRDLENEDTYDFYLDDLGFETMIDILKIL